MIRKHLHVWYYTLSRSHMGFSNPIIYNEIPHLPCHVISLGGQNETWALEDCRNDQGPVLSPRLVSAASWDVLLLTVLQISVVTGSLSEETDGSHLCHQAQSRDLC